MITIFYSGCNFWFAIHNNTILPENTKTMNVQSKGHESGMGQMSKACISVSSVSISAHLWPGWECFK